MAALRIADADIIFSSCGFFFFFLLMAPHAIGQAIIFSPWFLFLSFFFFSWHNLSRRRLNVYHTCTRCGLSANLDCLSEMCCTWLAENTKYKNYAKPAIWHHRTTLSGYIFGTKHWHVSTSGQKLVKQQYLSHMSPQCPHNMVNFGPLAAEIG